MVLTIRQTSKLSERFQVILRDENGRGRMSTTFTANTKQEVLDQVNKYKEEYEMSEVKYGMNSDGNLVIKLK